MSDDDQRTMLPGEYIVWKRILSEETQNGWRGEVTRMFDESCRMKEKEFPYYADLYFLNMWGRGKKHIE